MVTSMPKELKDLIAWFENYEVTFNEIELSECEHIFDLRKFITVQLNSIRRNWENPTFRSDIKSLFRLKIILEKKEQEKQ